jgi:hypothetical protein
MDTGVVVNFHIVEIEEMIDEMIDEMIVIEEDQEVGKGQEDQEVERGKEEADQGAVTEEAAEGMQENVFSSAGCSMRL